MSTTDRKALMHPGTITMLYVGEMHPTNCTECDCQHHRHGSGGGTREDPSSRCRCGHYTYLHRFRPFDPADPICQNIGRP